MKIHQVGAELFHADGQTDVTKPIVVAFRNFAKAPKTTVIKDVMTEHDGEVVQITQKTTE